MPAPIYLDVERVRALHMAGSTIREIAAIVGAGRSSVQRSIARRIDPLSAWRREAGPDPLPAGHPLSWGAIAFHVLGPFA